MDSDIARYLNHHLAGSSSSLPLIRDLADKHHEPAARTFFGTLHEQVIEDCRVMEGMLRTLGHSPGKLAAIPAGSAQTEMFEKLELLSLAIQKKKLMWAVCHEVSPMYPEWNQYDFAGQEMRAIGQRDDVEKWRKRSAAEILPHLTARMSA